jgi:hypothetical protein
MNTIINDVKIKLEMTSFDKHEHDKYLMKLHSKPFCVAYVELVSTEQVEPIRDELTVFVDVRLIDNLYPKFYFWVVDKEELNEQQAPCGGFGDNEIEEILNDLSDAIHYHEVQTAHFSEVHHNGLM